MIAQELFTDEAIATRSGTRASRARAEARRRKTLARRYRSVRRVVVAIAIATLVVVSYVGLLDRTTQLNYQRSQLAATRDDLERDTSRLEDQRARLESRERLAFLARGLGMHDPTDFAVANVIVDRPPAAPPRGLALIAGWLR